MRRSALCDSAGDEVQTAAANFRRHCVLVSAVASRLEVLIAGVAAAGWGVDTCQSAGVASRAVRKHCARLVLVDMTGTDDWDAVRLEGLADLVSRMGGLFVVLGACESDERLEIRARQLGAWVYLAGDLSIDQVSAITADARTLIERLDRTSAPTAGQDFSGMVPQWAAEGVC